MGTERDGRARLEICCARLVLYRRTCASRRSDLLRPSYIGRHTDYYNGFSHDDADELANALIVTPADFALSMWLENQYRRHAYVDRWFTDFPQRIILHFYHVAPSESLRNEMTEVVILSAGAATQPLPSTNPTLRPIEA